MDELSQRRIGDYQPKDVLRKPKHHIQDAVYLRLEDG